MVTRVAVAKDSGVSAKYLARVYVSLNVPGPRTDALASRCLVIRTVANVLVNEGAHLA